MTDTAVETKWTSRIVGTGKVAPADVLPHPMNLRRHTPKQERILLALLLTGGSVAPIIVSKRTKRILDGHLRHKIATQHAIAELDVVWVDVDEEEEIVVLATLDPLGLMAEPLDSQHWAVSQGALLLATDGELRKWLETFAPAGVFMDHTEVFLGDDSAGEGGVIRQISFHMDVPGYERAVRVILDVMERFKLEDSYEAVSWLIKEYGGV